MQPRPPFNDENIYGNAHDENHACDPLLLEGFSTFLKGPTDSWEMITDGNWWWK